jgi:hypothetical protein
MSFLFVQIPFYSLWENVKEKCSVQKEPGHRRNRHLSFDLLKFHKHTFFHVKRPPSIFDKFIHLELIGFESSSQRLVYSFYNHEHSHHSH